MDSVFGIGAPELIVILILAGVVMGPHRIREVALWLGRTTAALQSISRGFVRQLNAELDAVDGGGDLRSTMTEVKDLQQQIKDLRKELTTAAITPVREGKEILEESKQILQESQEMVQQSIAPPSLRPSNSDVAKDGQEATTEPAELPKLVDVADDPE
jgi:Sec-independent protein translocase protein TatA